MPYLLLFLLLPTLLFAKEPPNNPDANEFAGEALVLEGDIIVINRKPLFFYGIDAPDKGQTCTMNGHEYDCGEQATNALRTIIGGKKVRCVEKNVDKYNRTLAECFQGKVNLNAWMVDHGWAVAYRRYSLVYAPNEDQAKASKLGIWRGDFEKPWIYRYNEQKKETEKQKKKNKNKAEE